MRSSNLFLAQLPQCAYTSVVLHTDIVWFTLVLTRQRFVIFVALVIKLQAITGKELANGKFKLDI